MFWRCESCLLWCTPAWGLCASPIAAGLSPARCHPFDRVAGLQPVERERRERPWGGQGKLPVLVTGGES